MRIAAPRRVPLPSGLVAAAAVLTLVACTGALDGDDVAGPPGTDPVTPTDSRLPARVWRLSSDQIDAEVTRMFGAGAPLVGLPATATAHGLANIAATSGIDDGNVSQLIDGTRGVASWVVTNGASASQCGASWGTPACIDTFLAWFLPSAYRRPVTADETSALRTLYTDVLGHYDNATAFAAVVRAVLMSPDFLYRTELGPSPMPLAAGARTTLTGDEIAVLLSFTLTESAPDAELAAASGSLANPDERERQARRLIARSGPVWRHFFWQWLRMDTLRSQGVEVGLATNIVDQMEEEYGAYIDDVVVAHDGTFEDVFSATHTFVRPELAAHYGVSHPGTGLARVELDPTQRGGLLTMGAWLLSHGKRGKDNVVRRGMGVFRDAMCNDVAPPVGVDVSAAQAALVHSANPTVLEGVMARDSTGTCATCHHLADPVGLAFENYTSDGRWQSIYPDGRAVQSTIDIAGVGMFTDAPMLSLSLTQNGAFRSCFVRRFANAFVGFDMGEPAHVTWLSEASASMHSHDDRLTELLVALVRHPAFIERQN